MQHVSGAGTLDASVTSSIGRHGHKPRAPEFAKFGDDLVVGSRATTVTRSVPTTRASATAVLLPLGSDDREAMPARRLNRGKRRTRRLGAHVDAGLGVGLVAVVHSTRTLPSSTREGTQSATDRDRPTEIRRPSSSSSASDGLTLRSQTSPTAGRPWRARRGPLESSGVNGSGNSKSTGSVSGCSSTPGLGVTRGPSAGGGAPGSADSSTGASDGGQAGLGHLR